MRLGRCLLCVGLLALPAAGQVTVPQALDRAKKDLDAALENLRQVRDQITAEKPGLAGEFEKVEGELATKRRQTRLARTAIADRAEQLRQLGREAATRGQDAAYLAGLLKDHALKIITLSNPGQPGLRADRETLAGDNPDGAALLEARLGLVDSSLDRLENLFGGSLAEGSAAGGDGKIVPGTFAAAGPLLWFQGEKLGGAATALGGGRLPVVEQADKVGPLFEGQETVLGLDITGGKARALAEVGGGFRDMVRKGGLWVWPIMILALISVILAIWKLLEFSRYRQPSETWVNAILTALRGNDRDKARVIAAQTRHPAAPVMENLIDLADCSPDVIEESLYEQLMGVQGKVSSLLPVIAITAATCPLFGLLGTVSGMIQTFNLITVFGSGDPKPLAGGISEALITTLFGLVVAIPALILHAFLSRRSQGIVQTTERLGLAFVNACRAK